MKTKIFLLTVISATIFACTPPIQTNIEKSLDPLEYKIDEAMGLFSAARIEHGEPDREKDGTWLNVGVRYKYAFLKKYVSLNMLKKVSGQAVFVSGPHQSEMDFKSPDDFGHYNPAFLKKTKSTLKEAMKRDAFNKLAQTLYDNELKSMARTFYRSHEYVKSKGGAMAYTIKYDPDAFRSFADGEEKAGYDWYESDTFPGFWVRRYADGTEGLFIELLEMVMNKYDADYK